jgi:hypothetical protein
VKPTPRLARELSGYILTPETDLSQSSGTGIFFRVINCSKGDNLRVRIRRTKSRGFVVRIHRLPLPPRLAGALASPTRRPGSNSGARP